MYSLKGRINNDNMKILSICVLKLYIHKMYEKYIVYKTITKDI